MKKTIIVIITCVCIAASANAQQGSGRLSLGTGLLYKNGMDITLAYEHEMNYRHTWEFFVNGYLQWAECASCGHICPESFWRNYRSYGFGVAYKPCMTRGRNHYGSLRIGASAGSDTNKFLGGLHLGYEHNYVLRAGWTLYWQVKSDVMIKGADVCGNRIRPPAMGRHDGNGKKADPHRRRCGAEPGDPRRTFSGFIRSP